MILFIFTLIIFEQIFGKLNGGIKFCHFLWQVAVADIQ